MKFYEIKIQPESSFSTPLKGDTLFGRVCWEAVYDSKLLEIKFSEAIDLYPKEPFAVFSSAFPVLPWKSNKYLFPMPVVPGEYLSVKNESLNRLEKKLKAKEISSKKWMVLDDSFVADFCSEEIFFTDKELKEEFFSDHETAKILESTKRTRNSIDRRTNTTGGSNFAPFSFSVYDYNPEIELALFVLIDEKKTSIEKISKALKNIGETGFGKDASIGMGRFLVKETRDISIPALEEDDGIFTLAPHVFDEQLFSNEFYKPFVRFGKHGGALALSGNPFKKPVMMADECAVLMNRISGKTIEKPFIGKAVTGISKSDKSPASQSVKEKTVHQGYSPYLPIKGLKSNDS